MSSRFYNDFITAYLKYSENSEPPKSYHTWVAVSLIAGALQRRVHFRWGHEKIYPNMYIVLVGPSGRCRKGTAIGIGKDLLKEINIATTSESITREALIRAMKNAMSNYTDAETQQFKFHCSLTAISPELSVFLGQNDLKFLSDLTDWYDSADTWTYETKGAGTDQIQGLCFNLLGATAPDWFSSILPQEALGGGFTSRIIFVVEDRKGKTVPKTELSQEHLEMRNQLRTDLEHITTMSGRFEFDPAAEAAYIAWYTEQERLMDSGHYVIDDARFSGYCDRRATHVRKLCMIVSASRSNDLVITKADFDRARMMLEAVEINMPRAFSGLGRATYSDVTERVLTYIKQQGIVTRSELMKRFYRDVDGTTLKVVEEVLEYMKVVRVKRDIERAETIYEYIGPS